ncbi:hypothetical protein Glo7428_2721 [Gloeocapsa sp. PCC 7428]|uniref:hypothetical protein n=1 Tax=Gloeocapsa sp. PCC 7428 TaxID=1173026 RepID=UPI0002A5F584|nr:hypothetical protein [Gloeocapsa sp. PCC 7428]AFZ31222.1 hypothetical protein Glo7428_2721 [Gloeocapsa sp. PCC 7428]
MQGFGIAKPLLMVGLRYRSLTVGLRYRSRTVWLMVDTLWIVYVCLAAEGSYLSKSAINVQF